MNSIDLRSDTLTLPTPEMLNAMMKAPLGDDVFGEDPTVCALEEYAAALFGKEAALFCSSGTQTNQIAIMCHTHPGGEVITHEESHIYKYEGGGIALNSGASVKLIQGNMGRILPALIPGAINNPLDVHLPLTQLVSLEDTANRGGGSVYDIQDINAIKSMCEEFRLPLHLDGARVFNALTKNKMESKTYGNLFDSLSICLSKGLGAPVGSVLIGSKAFITKARRKRKVMGGGMRQAGIIAAAGLYALNHHVERLQEDHDNAQRLEASLRDLPWVEEILPVETNIVVVRLKDPSRRDEIIDQLKKDDLLCIAFGPGLIRFVTHLNVTRSMIDQAVILLKRIR
ncbi:MAG: threonine aldolase family protein [Flavobacteriales bacterium]